MNSEYSENPELIDNINYGDIAEALVQDDMQYNCPPPTTLPLPKSFIVPLQTPTSPEAEDFMDYLGILMKEENRALISSQTPPQSPDVQFVDTHQHSSHNASRSSSSNSDETCMPSLSPDYSPSFRAPDPRSVDDDVIEIIDLDEEQSPQSPDIVYLGTYHRVDTDT